MTYDGSVDINVALLPSSWAEELFDLVPEVVFFIKDRAGRYAAVNQTLVERCGLAGKRAILGRTTADLFPTPLGKRYLEQDRQVCSSGVAMTNLLELHLYPNRSEGWCLTDKLPLGDADGRVIGLVGLSRDVQLPGESRLDDLAAVVEHIRRHHAEELRVEALADLAGMSVYQLNRRLRSVFALTASQLITKTRIDAASHLLRTSSQTVTAIALACGYGDHSAFTRQFGSAVGLSPSQYRRASSRAPTPENPGEDSQP